MVVTETVRQFSECFLNLDIKHVQELYIIIILKCKALSLNI